MGDIASAAASANGHTLVAVRSNPRHTLVEGLERRSRNRIAPRRRRERRVAVVVVLLAAVGDSRWRSIDLGIEVGWCDSSGEDLKVAVLRMERLAGS